MLHSFSPSVLHLGVSLPETFLQLEGGDGRNHMCHIDHIRRQPRIHHTTRGLFSGENAIIPKTSATAISKPRAKPNTAPRT